jgi:hypothetical protein
MGFLSPWLARIRGIFPRNGQSRVDVGSPSNLFDALMALKARYAHAFDGSVAIDTEGLMRRYSHASFFIFFLYLGFIFVDHLRRKIIEEAEKEKEITLFAFILPCSTHIVLQLCLQRELLVEWVYDCLYFACYGFTCGEFLHLVRGSDLTKVVGYVDMGNSSTITTTIWLESIETNIGDVRARIAYAAGITPSHRVLIKTGSGALCPSDDEGDMDDDEEFYDNSDEDEIEREFVTSLINQKPLSLLKAQNAIHHTPGTFFGSDCITLFLVVKYDRRDGIGLQSRERARGSSFFSGGGSSNWGTPSRDRNGAGVSADKGRDNILTWSIERARGGSTGVWVRELEESPDNRVTDPLLLDDDDHEFDEENDVPLLGPHSPRRGARARAGRGRGRGEETFEESGGRRRSHRDHSPGSDENSDSEEGDYGWEHTWKDVGGETQPTSDSSGASASASASAYSLLHDDDSAPPSPALSAPLMRAVAHSARTLQATEAEAARGVVRALRGWSEDAAEGRVIASSGSEAHDAAGREGDLSSSSSSMARGGELEVDGQPQHPEEPPPGGDGRNPGRAARMMKRVTGALATLILLYLLLALGAAPHLADFSAYLDAVASASGDSASEGGGDKGGVSSSDSPIVSHKNASAVLARRYQAVRDDFVTAMRDRTGWRALRSGMGVSVEVKPCAQGWPHYIKTVATVPLSAEQMYSMFQWEHFEETQRAIDPFVDYAKELTTFHPVQQPKSEDEDEDEGEGEGKGDDSVNVLYRKEMRGPPLMPKRAFFTVLRNESEAQHLALPCAGATASKEDRGCFLHIPRGTRVHAMLDVALPSPSSEEPAGFGSVCGGNTDEARAALGGGSGLLKGLRRGATLAYRLANEDEGGGEDESPQQKESVIARSDTPDPDFAGNKEEQEGEGARSVVDEEGAPHEQSAQVRDEALLRAAHALHVAHPSSTSAVRGFHDFLAWYVDNGDGTTTSVVCMRFGLGPDVPRWLFLSTVGLVSLLGMRALEKHGKAFRARGSFGEGDRDGGGDELHM